MLPDKRQQQPIAEVAASAHKNQKTWMTKKIDAFGT
jgi:hypothetical protein